MACPHYDFGPHVDTPNIPKVPMKLLEHQNLFYVCWAWGGAILVYSTTERRVIGQLEADHSHVICLFDVIEVASNQFVWLVCTDNKQLVVFHHTTFIQEGGGMRFAVRGVPETLTMKKRVGGLALLENDDRDLQMVFSDKFGDIRILALSQVRATQDKIQENLDEKTGHEKIDGNANWEKFAEKVEGCLAGHLASVTIQILVDGRLLITADRDEKIIVHRFPEVWIYLGILTGHTEFVTDVCFFKGDGNHSEFLLSCAADRTLRVWNLTAEPEEIQCFPTGDDRIPLRIVQLLHPGQQEPSFAVLFCRSAEYWVCRFPDRLCFTPSPINLSEIPLNAISSPTGSLLWVDMEGALWETAIGETSEKLVVPQPQGKPFFTRPWKHNREPGGQTQQQRAERRRGISKAG